MSERVVRVVLLTMLLLLASPDSLRGQDGSKVDSYTATSEYASDSVHVARRVSMLDSTIERLEAAIIHYEELAASGGWRALPGGSNLRLGSRGPRIAVLRERLSITGDLMEDVMTADSTDRGNDDPSTRYVFDEAVDRAVRRFQERHGLEVDGIVGPKTRAALNVPVKDRIRQLKINLKRLRAEPASFGSRFAVVNVPGFRLDVIEDGASVMSMKVIVGRPSTPTPLFETRIEEVILAPYWYVPASITRNELLPRERRDPGYMERNRIRQLPNGTYRQDPGPTNPLGKVKFTIPNPHGVVLHGTSEPWLFERAECAFSHGCMRIERPVDLAVYLLEGTRWTREEIEREIATWKQRIIRVRDPLPVYVRYWTAWVGEDGTVHFRRDLYGHDASGFPHTTQAYFPAHVDWDAFVPS